MFNLNDFIGSKASISVSGNLWVSFSAILNHGLAKKATLKNPSWKIYFAPVENVNKNINKARGFEPRPSLASKTPKELRSTYCVSESLRFSHSSHLSLLFTSLSHYYRVCRISLLKCKSFCFCFCFCLCLCGAPVSYKPRNLKEKLKSLHECSRLTLSSPVEYNLERNSENLKGCWSPDKQSNCNVNRKNFGRKHDAVILAVYSNILTSKNKSCFSSERHRASTVVKKLLESSDVESNPGPNSNHEHTRNESRNKGSIEVISYNFRGLNDQKS